VDGDPGNLKITWPADLTMAAALLAAREERR
jgi:2-C-methyl-D-erythritol 4-phosphate cytidylyltransferase